jgi:hypothetical protein
VTISGTAADTGGGVVGGVEVSTDNGTSWHPATGRVVIIPAAASASSVVVVVVSGKLNERDMECRGSLGGSFI